MAGRKAGAYFLFNAAYTGISGNANAISELGVQQKAENGGLSVRYFVVTKKHILGGLLCLAVLALAGCFIAGSAAVPTAVRPRKLPIYCVQTDQKQAALSFDVAMEADGIQLLIDILERYGVKATFFVAGSWAEKYPQAAKALRDAGHDVENHSDDHPHMPELSKEEMLQSIRDCNEKVEAATGKRPTLFRAPYGDYDDALLDVLEEMGMQCIQWDVDSLDWKDKSADQILSRVTAQTTPGSIIRFHNDAKNTSAALPGVIEALQQDGYSLVPVSRLVRKEGYSLNQEGRQIPASAPQETAELPKTTASSPA